MQAIAEDSSTDLQVAKDGSVLQVAQSIFYINLRQNYCATGGDHQFLRIGLKILRFRKRCKNFDPTCRGNRTIIKTTRERSNKLKNHI